MQNGRQREPAVVVFCRSNQALGKVKLQRSKATESAICSSSAIAWETPAFAMSPANEIG
jgi:hypothetical protein